MEKGCQIFSEPQAIQQGQVQIGVARTEEEKSDIYRFRYRIYVEEMDKLPAIQGGDALLYDELDEWGLLLYARAGHEIVGTMRVNIGTREQFSPSWQTMLSLERFQRFYGKEKKPLFSYSSKFMIAPRYRNSAISYLLPSRGYELECSQGVEFSFGLCNLYLLRLYEQFGFQRFGGHIEDAEFGLLSPFVLLVNDIAHLKAVRSPYYRLARKRAADTGSKDWFYREFTENSDIINSQLITDEGLWEYLTGRLEDRPEQIMTLLRGLSAREGQKLVGACGVVVRCPAGETIVRQGSSSYDVNVVLAGQVQARDGSVVYPGESFGTNGLLVHPRQGREITAKTDAEILVLSSLSFAKFAHNDPATAHRVIINLSQDS